MREGRELPWLARLQAGGGEQAHDVAAIAMDAVRPVERMPPTVT